MTKKTSPKPSESGFIVELVGGPKDGEVIAVPGPEPPPEYVFPVYIPTHDLMWLKDEPKIPLMPEFPKLVYRLDRWKGRELVYKYVEMQ